MTDSISEKTKFGSLFNSIPESLLIHEFESGRFIRANQFACDLYGYTEQEFMTLTLKQIVAPECIEDMAARAVKLKERNQLIFEVRHLKKGGVIFEAEVKINLIDFEGTLSAIVSVRDVSARRRALNELDEKRDRLRYLLDSLPQNIWLKDTEGVFLDGNLALANALGISKSDFPGKTDFDFFPVDIANKFRHDDRQVIESAKIKVMDEMEVIGTRNKHVRTTKIPILGTDGHVISTLGIAEDITDIKFYELQVLKLAQAVEQSPESIVITDLDGNIEFVNESFLYVSGYSRAELIGQNPRILQSGKTPPESYDQLWAALASGKRWQGELINRRKNGSEYIEFARIAPIRQDDGTITHYLAVKEDITEKKRNSTILLESKNLLQRIMDSIPDWIFVIDRVNKYMMVNQSYANFYGTTPESMIGLSDAEIYQALKDDRTTVDFIVNNQQDINAVFAGRTITYLKEEFIFSGNTVYYFETHWYPLFDPDRKTYGALCYRRNITERINFELGQKQLQEQLHQSQKLELVGQFTGGIAHDFNNILASILGYADLLKSSVTIEENPKLDRFVDQILLVGLRARDLIRNLLVFSKINEPNLEVIDAAAVAIETIDNMLPTFPKSISVQPPNNPGVFKVLMNSIQLHQIIMNLVLNARDAIMEKGQDDGEIIIHISNVAVNNEVQCDACHLQFSGKYVLITVKDNGLGIEQDCLHRIFDPFFTTKKLAGGTGLGLSVLHGIIHSCNGHIKVQSTPGAGTLFELYLPMSGGEITTATPNVQSRQSRGKNNAHIMVVDDESDVVNYLSELLTAAGYRVAAFTDPEAALHHFQRDPDAIDLVITDQEMKELKGTLLAQALLAQRPALPVILCTGFSNDINEQSAIEMGIRQFFIKPVPNRRLLEAINGCIKGQ